MQLKCFKTFYNHKRQLQCAYSPKFLDVHFKNCVVCKVKNLLFISGFSLLPSYVVFDVLMFLILWCHRFHRNPINLAVPHNVKTIKYYVLSKLTENFVFSLFLFCFVFKKGWYTFVFSPYTYFDTTKKEFNATDCFQNPTDKQCFMLKWSSQSPDSSLESLTKHKIWCSQMTRDLKSTQKRSPEKHNWKNVHNLLNKREWIYF